MQQLLRTAQMVSSVQEETMLRPSRVAEQRFSCQACNTSVQSSFTWCPSCGAALKAQPCAYCGQTLAPSDKTCSACGAPRVQRVHSQARVVNPV
ncbi:MAG: hypothetical protein HN736_10955 [Anaerolineae bacterium]|nr:hypothetical protein [Anaerolineae bacterium]MBT4309618.1 hypothetical protein [Anaerolineae bacterium]MBT4456981.1 hypothetical protein [Anaerolineae bacterium]MBT4843233.1 hypothetical protein [Anaerolineae bacterium]MBT6060660.1 hypothetical protein [Anaerolineae bacterium]